MKDGAKKAGKPIDKVLSDYGDFMENYHMVKNTIENSKGQAMGNKLKETFKLFAEKAYKDSWKEVSKLSPEIKSTMNSMNNRELFKNFLKVTGATATLGLAGKGATDMLTGK